MRNNYFILRHGQTPYQLRGKEERVIYPWPEPKPVSLTKEGRKQAETAARELKKEKIDIIYSSDTARTRETAEIVNREIGAKIIFSSRLGDLNTGIFRGGPLKDYRNYFSSLKERFWKVPPKGESLKECQDRMFDFLEEIDKKRKGKRILIVSHKAPLWLLEGRVKGLSPRELFSQEVQENRMKPAEFRKLV